MKDINGIEIKVGQMVKTQQKSGGVLPPAPAQIGEVCIANFNNAEILCIKFRKEGQDFDSYISLYGKINEVMFEENVKKVDGFSVNGDDMHWKVECPNCERELEFKGYFDNGELNKCYCGCIFKTRRVYLCDGTYMENI